jgi:hypothetical protein
VTLDRKLLAEARQERVCAECGYERETAVCGGRPSTRSLMGAWQGLTLRGVETLVCLGCRPEFVVNPHEARAQ